MGNFKFGHPYDKNSVYLNLESVIVRVGNRNLNTRYTRQMVHDIEVFHNIDAEAELTRILSEQIARPMDLEWVRKNIMKITPFKFGR